MTLLQIQYFVEVSKYHSFSIAAEKNFVSQPTISNAISGLETEIGRQLFYRGKPLELTPDGKEFLYYCRELLEHYDFVCNFKKTEEHVIRIGIPPMLSAMILPEIYHNAGDTKVVLHEHYFQELMRDLMNGSIDIMFHYDSWIKDDTLEVKKLRPMKHMISAHKRFDLPQGRNLNAADLKGIPIALRSRDSRLNELIQGAMKEVGITPDIVCETDQIKTLEMIVRFGIGAAFLNESVFHNDPNVLSYPYGMEGKNYNISIVYKKGLLFPPYILHFIETFTLTDQFSYQPAAFIRQPVFYFLTKYPKYRINVMYI